MELTTRVGEKGNSFSVSSVLDPVSTRMLWYPMSVASAVICLYAESPRALSRCHLKRRDAIIYCARRSVGARSRLGLVMLYWALRVCAAMVYVQMTSPAHMRLCARLEHKECPASSFGVFKAAPYLFIQDNRFRYFLHRSA
jgi:hypothetical protein